ncbi:MAG TPA: Uma2 family endonuclease [Gemmatimonadales bacterium]|nr:Uma2 family endonuclease [Gemmatimonadales bacterium]
MSAHRLITAEELERMGTPDGNCELVRGVLVPVNPPGPVQGDLAVRIASALRAFVRPRRLGTVYVETGYILERDPDTVRGPDVSFLSRERAEALGSRGYVSNGPDLAVEIRSPDQTLAQLSAKLREYLNAGTRLAWLVDPHSRTVRVFEPKRPTRVLRIGDVLEGGNVLPGFSLSVTELFAEE